MNNTYLFNVADAKSKMDGGFIDGQYEIKRAGHSIEYAYMSSEQAEAMFANWQRGLGGIESVRLMADSE